MGSSQQLLFGGVAVGGGTDPNFSSVVALLHFDGTNGSTTVTNSCPRGSTWACGSGTSLTTSVQKFGTASLDCAAGNAGCTSTSSPDYVMGTGDFTVEFSYFAGIIADAYSFDMGNAAVTFRFDPREPTGATIEVAGSVFLGNTLATQISASAWHQIAVTRVSGTMYFFIDGTMKASASSSHNFAGSQLSLGKSISGGFPNVCQIDEFRLTKGVGRYTANYTVAAAAFPDS